MTTADHVAPPQASRRNDVQLFLAIVVVYFVVDVLYQVAFGIRFNTDQYERAGIDGIFADPPRHLYLFVVFFAVIGLANLVLVVKPSIVERSVRSAAKKGALLGLTAYGTLAMTTTWSIADYPLASAIAIASEGTFFSAATPAAITWWALRGPS
ncbi:MAG: DUF2177 family protein [Actinomycetota bacterium]